MSNDPTSSRGPLIVLIAGSLLVAGLLGWALTRQVEPAPLPSTTPTATTATSGQLDTSAAPSATTSSVTADEAAGVKRISADELKLMVDRAAVTVIDVRDAASYNSGHIPGSLHIPMARVEGEVQYLPKDKPIVTYCT